jgi:Fe-S cluster assembly iron-binding protein IscA
MLALTQGAADAVESIVAQPEAPESAVLRITTRIESGNGGAPNQELEMALVTEPQEDDVLVEGIPIAVEPSTLEFLDDKILDAEIDNAGFHFSLYLQPPAQMNGGAPTAGD